MRGQVFALGVTLNGQPVTRKQLGQLFDSIDLDHSGWLDLEEAKTALKDWESQAVASIKERVTKEKKVRRIKRLASRKLQAALRESSSSSLLTAGDAAAHADDLRWPTSSPGRTSSPRPASPQTVGTFGRPSARALTSPVPIAHPELAASRA